MFSKACCRNGLHIYANAIGKALIAAVGIPFRTPGTFLCGSLRAAEDLPDLGGFQLKPDADTQFIRPYDNTVRCDVRLAEHGVIV